MAIEPGPAALDHRHLGVGEVVDHLADDRRGRNKVGVKDGDELARRRLQPFRQRSSLEPFPVIAVVIGDGVARPGVFTHEARAHDLGLVSRIVEHLDFQELPRVVDASDSLEQPLDHVALVIHRQLDGDARQALESLPRLGEFAAVLEIQISQIVAMDAINRKDDQNGKVRNQDREVKSVGMVEPAKRVPVKDLEDIADHWILRSDQAG